MARKKKPRRSPSDRPAIPPRGMPAQRTETTNVWHDFADRHPQRGDLNDGNLYSLPSQLVVALQQEAPGLLDRDDVNFERDLAETAGTGFFLQRPFHCPQLGEPVPRAQVTSSLNLRQAKSDAALRKLMTEEMQSLGRTDEEIERYFVALSPSTDELETQAGYMGWLICERGFCGERDKQFARCKSNILARGSFPGHAISLIGEKPDTNGEHWLGEWYVFLRRWGLDTFYTWELPSPMQPALVGTTPYCLELLNEAGVVAFVPWHALRPKQTSIPVERFTYLPADHVAGWMYGQNKQWGPRQYAALLRTYVYFELALRQRYAAKLKGILAKVDFAFNGYFRELRRAQGGPLRGRHASLGRWHPEDENMSNDFAKKIRLKLQKNLKAR